MLAKNCFSLKIYSIYVIKAKNLSQNIRKALNSALMASMSAKFCEDVTFPDGATVLCGQKYTKTWKIINNGTRAWTTDVSHIYFTRNELLFVAMIFSYFFILFLGQTRMFTSTRSFS